MVVDSGRFVFDWENMFSRTEPAVSPASNGSNLGTGKDAGRKQEVSERFLSRLLKKVKVPGVIRIVEYSIAPSGNKIVFAVEFEESIYRPKETHLWLVNRDGTGLRRLTENHHSVEPAWSPSGKEIAFRNIDSISVIDVRQGSQETYVVFRLTMPGKTKITITRLCIYTPGGHTTARPLQQKEVMEAQGGLRQLKQGRVTRFFNQAMRYTASHGTTKENWSSGLVASSSSIGVVAYSTGIDSRRISRA